MKGRPKTLIVPVECVELAVGIHRQHEQLAELRRKTADEIARKVVAEEAKIVAAAKKKTMPIVQEHIQESSALWLRLCEEMKIPEVERDKYTIDYTYLEECGIVFLRPLGFGAGPDFDLTEMRPEGSA